MGPQHALFARRSDDAGGQGSIFIAPRGAPYRLALYDRTGFIVESFANIAKVYDLCDPVNIEAFNREQRVGNLLYPSKLPGTALAYSVMEDFELAVGTDGRGHQTVRRKVGILWLIQKGESNLHDLFVDFIAAAGGPCRRPLMLIDMLQSCKS